MRYGVRDGSGGGEGGGNGGWRPLATSWTLHRATLELSVCYDVVMSHISEVKGSDEVVPLISRYLSSHSSLHQYLMITRIPSTSLTFGLPLPLATPPPPIMGAWLSTNFL